MALHGHPFEFVWADFGKRYRFFIVCFITLHNADSVLGGYLWQSSLALKGASFMALVIGALP